jgi:hypothetical protein
MEEIVIKEAKAQYLKSAINMLEGYLILTNKRILYVGKAERNEWPDAINNAKKEFL